jgi:hypothetical protein
MAALDESRPHREVMTAPAGFEQPHVAGRTIRVPHWTDNPSFQRGATITLTAPVSGRCRTLAACAHHANTLDRINEVTASIGLVVLAGRSSPWSRGSERRRRPRAGRHREPHGAQHGPHLVHLPSDSSGSQRSLAVHRWPRWLVRSWGNRPGRRTLTRMRSSAPSI